ncbi:MAG: EamA/RhaT family transporter, partial [Kiloniellales bacterium]
SAHFCMAQALRLADATLVVPLDFLRLPLIAWVGMLLYAEALDPWVFLGGALILAANIASLRAARRSMARA